ncbi:MAG: hypothetical protein JXA72_14280 [Bacteroidales bacterium]|nr:hypothetical protein [Bacteroidales bacterium]
MKMRLWITGLVIAVLLCNCEKDDNGGLGGSQSAMGEVGEQLDASNSSGVSNATATVTSLEDGISTMDATATITNEDILDILENVPEFTVSGNSVSVSDVQFRITTEGIESKIPAYPGIIVKYDSKVGDVYSGGSGIEREVIYKSSDDDYPYGFMYIKVIKVEESPTPFPGVSKIAYIANHRFGMVGIDFTLDDNSIVHFTLYGSVEN